MKKLCLLLGVTFLPFYVSSQDIIYKSDGSEIKAKVVEIKTDKIEYFNFEESKDTLRKIPLNEVFMIIYGGGTKEVFKTNSVSDRTTYNKDEQEYTKVTKDKVSIDIIDKRENKIIIGKGPSDLARGVGLIVQPATEIKDEDGKIFSYVIKTLNKILEDKEFVGNVNSNYTLELNINELYHKAQVGLYGTGGDVTQNCRCNVTLKSNNKNLFNKDFMSTYSAKTSDFSDQEDLLYKQYYSINDKKELNQLKKADFKEYSSKGHFINFIVILDDIINQLVNDEEFKMLF